MKHLEWSGRDGEGRPGHQICAHARPKGCKGRRIPESTQRTSNHISFEGGRGDPGLPLPTLRPTLPNQKALRTKPLWPEWKADLWMIVYIGPRNKPRILLSMASPQKETNNHIHSHTHLQQIIRPSALLIVRTRMFLGQVHLVSRLCLPRNLGLQHPMLDIAIACIQTARLLAASSKNIY